MIGFLMARLEQLEARFERLIERVWFLEARLRTVEEENRRLRGL